MAVSSDVAPPSASLSHSCLLALPLLGRRSHYSSLLGHLSAGAGVG
jgi:hypothetical protein